MSGDSSKPTQPRLTPFWGPAATFLFAFFILIFAQFFASAALGAIVGLSGNLTRSWLNTNEAQFVFVVIFEAATVGFIWFFLRIRKLGWRAIGLSRAPNWRDLGYVLLGFLVYFGLLVVTSLVTTQLLNVNSDQRQNIGFTEVLGAGQLAMIFVSLVILPPIVEELLFRGFLFGGLRTKLSFWPATIVTSLSFGAIHLLTGFEGEALLWIAGIDTFVLSLVLCYAREKTGALWACIGIHALKNAIAFLYLSVVQ